MPSFTDTNNREWTIRFDGITLGELRDAHAIDLADIGGESYLKIETDQASLTKAVCFLCRDQLKSLTAKDLADALTGQAAEDALQAIWGAAKVFFRPKLWSALQSAYKQRQETQEQWDQIRPMMALLNDPMMPEAIRATVTEQLATMMLSMSSTDSQTSEEHSSATGPVVNQSKPATASQASAELAPAA
jgi:hypothetical protein